MKFPIEIKAFDNVPMMIETKQLNYWRKCHHGNEGYILEKTIDGRFYKGKYISMEDTEPYQTYILADRKFLKELMRLEFKPADIASCEEILKIHNKEVKRYGLYGVKK